MFTSTSRNSFEEKEKEKEKQPEKKKKQKLSSKALGLIKKKDKNKHKDETTSKQPPREHHSLVEEKGWTAKSPTKTKEKLKREKKEPREHAREDCWPDCVREGTPVVDDVSQLNATEVHAIYQVRTIEDVKDVLRQAHATGHTVSVRGTKHSMGGHSMSHDGIIIDMKYVAHMHYDKEKNWVTVGTGTMWADLIRYLNVFGKAPRTLQSYCSFSVGGTLSVNGHGITTDYSVSESVLAMKLITLNHDKKGGDLVEVIECSRDSSDERHRELFRLALGGYGLFGLIYEVTLKVSDNTRLFMDAMTIPIKELPHVYDAVRASPEVEMKLARIDTTGFTAVKLFVFRRAADTPTVSDLGIKPKEMTLAGRLMYKWFAGPMREARFAIEQEFDVALDWSDVSDRNEMLYESAAPLARLYSPLLRVDDTFILQEYFIPHDNYAMFIEEAKEVILNKVNKGSALVTLLNITIRYVNHDTDTALPYASHEKGVFAFVLYYRIRRTPEADVLLQSYHEELAKIAVEECQGTFYLPYRHHYTDELLTKAYPCFDKFCERKAHYDPIGLFNNHWWARYGRGPKSHPSKALDHEKGKEKEQEGEGHAASPYVVVPKAIPDYKPPEVTTRRTNSFRDLLLSPKMRQEFFEGFLVEIFSIYSNKKMYREMATSTWDPRNKSDEEIYASLLASLTKSNSGPVTQLTSLWSSIKQLADQKQELTRETVSIIARLGKLGDIHHYCSIGDNGKMILPLRKALGMTGKAWIVHDNDAGDDDIAAVLERGAINARDVGEFVRIDYNNIREGGKGELSKIEDEVCDLVTMNQGLHHLPPDKIMAFLAAVYRVLRPGGLFIVREHDLDEEKKLMPMLDCAHMVFNAGTGVSIKMEREEIRGFRPLLQWREIIQAAGLRDTLLYEMQPNDPTIDIMMCFYKPPLAATCNRAAIENPIHLPPVSNPLTKLLSFLPGLTLEVGMTVLETILNTLPKLRTMLQESTKAIGSDIPGLKEAATVLVNQYINPALMMLERFRPLAAEADPHLGAELIPDELFLLIPALRARAAKGGIFEGVIVDVVDKIAGFFKQYMASTPVPASPGGKGSLIAAPAWGDIEAVKREVAESLEKLMNAIPELRHLEDYIDEMGVPPKALGIARSFLASNIGSKEKTVTWLVDNVDKKGWMAMKAAFEEIIKAGQPPHFDLFLQEGTPWNKATVALLGSPKMQIPMTASYLAGPIGLGPVIKMWKTAQQKRRREDASDPGHLPASVVESIQGPLDDICPVKESVGFDDIENVLAVISANYVAESIIGLSSKQVDVTMEIAATLNPETGFLPVSQARMPATLRLGAQKLAIRYRQLPKQKDSTTFMKVTKALNQALADSGLIDGGLKSQSGPLTWYKLSEWMQVEIVQIFGESMDHTPWYRFPFMGVIKTYFEVLSKEATIVAEKYGWPAALGSSAFLTDAIPGIVMGFLFGQMTLLAYPLKRLVGESYDADSLFEECVVTAPRGTDWSALDSRIRNVTEVVGGVWTLSIPTFKPFTEVLLKMAKRLPSGVLLQISNQSVVQVKVEMAKDESLKASAIGSLKRLTGCDVKFEFRFPPIGGGQEKEITYPSQVSLAVQVPYLLSVLRYCIENDITVVQVYDFWG